MKKLGKKLTPDRPVPCQIRVKGVLDKSWADWDARLVVDPWRQRAGWAAAALSTLITCFWAFWGIVENFHEGWYHSSLPANVGLMLIQYLSPMLIFMALTLAAIVWPRAGAGLHLLFAIFAAWFFGALANPVTLLFVLPLVGLGALYWFGRPRPRRIAILLTAGLPLLTLLIAGIGPAVRVSRRVDDGNRRARLVRGNGVDLIWAPQGPGWPRSGADWDGAQAACGHLGEDGLALSPTPQQIWRLPTVDEAVRSMARHGENSGGIWEAASTEATYSTTPDKESPLWDPYSQVIYWWTATEVDAEHAYIIVYDGKVWPRAKEFGPAYLGFRCVREP